MILMPLRCSSPDVPFAEPMKVPAGSLFLIRSELASPPQSWDPKTGREAPPIYCGFSKASETAQVEAFSCAPFEMHGSTPFSFLSLSAENERKKAVSSHRTTKMHLSIYT